jgi:hypothetical protein
MDAAWTVSCPEILPPLAPPRERQAPIPQEVNPISARPISDEHWRIERRLMGFNWQQSNAWFNLTYLYGPDLSHNELVSIGDLLAAKLHIKLDRDARRRKPVMVKWFDEHWMLVFPLLRGIVLQAP